MALIGEQQVRNIFIVATAPDDTMTEVRAGALLNGAIINADGTAVAADEGFALAVKNWKGDITMSDVVDPSKVKYAHSVDFKPRIETAYTVSGFPVPTAGDLYQISVEISGFGSLSVENEYVKKGFYKAVTGDTAEDVVDGLVASLARSMSREQPPANATFTYPDADGNVELQDNLYFNFNKSFSDGTNEVTTFQVTAAATVEGDAVVTLNGVDHSVPVTIASINDTAAELAESINAINGYSAVAATDTVTVTADLPEDQTDASFAAGTATTMAVTVVTTVDGVDGTAANAQLTISEKEDYLARYYVTGKKTRLNMDFSVRATVPSTVADLTITKTLGFAGQGTGYQVRNLEEYLLGNRQDTFRGAGYPHNFEEHYDSILTDQYFLIEIGYFDTGRNDPMKSDKQITIASNSKAAANAMIASINTALTNVGVSITALV